MKLTLLLFSQSYSSSSYSSSSYSSSSRGSSGGSFGGSSRATTGKSFKWWYDYSNESEITIWWIWPIDHDAVYLIILIIVTKTYVHPGDITAMRQPRTTAWKQNGVMYEMTMENMKACTTYRFSIEVKTVSKSGSREVEKNLGTIRDVVLPPMAFVSNFKLPLLSKV